MEVEVGQGIRLQVQNRVFYGVVMNVDDKNRNVLFLPVYAVMEKSDYGLSIRRKCYDDPDAKYERDRDNVRLRSCPPPFSNFGSYLNFKRDSVSNSFVYANLEKMYRVSQEKCVVIDDGAKISKQDMNTIYCHPWDSRNQRERVGLDITELNLDDDYHLER